MVVATAWSAPRWRRCRAIREPLRVALPLFAALVPVGHGLRWVASPFTSLSSLAGMLLGGALVVRSLRVAHRDRIPGTPRVAPLPRHRRGLLALDRRPSVTLQGLAVLASLVVVYLLVAMTPVDATAYDGPRPPWSWAGPAWCARGSASSPCSAASPSRAQTWTRRRPGGSERPAGSEPRAVALTLPLVVALNRAFAARGRLSGRGVCTESPPRSSARHRADGSRTGPARRPRPRSCSSAGRPVRGGGCWASARRRRGWPPWSSPSTRRHRRPDLRVGHLVVRAHRHLAGRPDRVHRRTAPKGRAGEPSPTCTGHPGHGARRHGYWSAEGGYQAHNLWLLVGVEIGTWACSRSSRPRRATFEAWQTQRAPWTSRWARWPASSPRCRSCPAWSSSSSGWSDHGRALPERR